MGDGLKTGCYKFYAGFKSVDNYVNSQGDIIALSENHTLLAANTIIVNRFSSGQTRHVEILDNKVLINNTPVSTNKAVTYCSKLYFNNYSRNEAVQIVYNFINKNRHNIPKDSLLQLLIDTPTNGTHDTICKTSKFDQTLWMNFKQAFSMFENDFYTCIRLFKGKGCGLTPSGDDFIAGVLYGLHFLELIEGKSHKHVKQQVYKIAAGKNLFSNNMFIMALHAQYFKRMKDFLPALFHQEHHETQKSFQQLISIGNTSGADLLAGFFSVILRYTVKTTTNKTDQG